MKKSNIEITQYLLDRSQPGKDAVSVLAGWDMGLVRNNISDIMLLKSMLYDGFSQSDFSMARGAKKPDINKTTFLLQELLYRYLNNVLGPEFIDQSNKLFEQALAYRNLAKDVRNDIRKIESKSGFTAVHRSVNTAFESFDSLLRDVYLLGDAKRILRDSVGSKSRVLYPQEQSAIPEFSGEAEPGKKRSNPFRIPMFEEMRKRLDEAHATVDQMDDKELCIRVLRSFDGTWPAETDTSSPVYGVKTVFAYTPMIVDRLMNGWTFDNQAVMDDLSTRMSDSTTQLMAIKARFGRLNDADCQRQIDYIADRFGDGECAAFAVALHQVTGLPVVLLKVCESNDPSLPTGFPRHAAVQVSNDQFLDGCGIASLEELNSRFDCRLSADKNPDLKSSIFEPERTKSPGSQAASEARGFAIQMLKLREIEVPAHEKLERRYAEESFEP